MIVSNEVFGEIMALIGMLAFIGMLAYLAYDGWHDLKKHHK